MANMVNISNMSKEAKDQRITLMMEATLADRIDSFRFARRIGSRAEAMRRLMIDALDQAGNSENSELNSEKSEQRTATPL